jgi:hypothetical protein
MSVKEHTNKLKGAALIMSFKDLGFRNFKAFVEVLKMDKSITLLHASNCWDGHGVTFEVGEKIERIINILKEGEHPLEYFVDGEFFRVDNSFISINYKGIKTMFYTKKVGDSTYTTLSVETLKALCENHKDAAKTGLTSRSMGYGRGKNSGD